jgi:uncharacterized protein YndB with AHSA1/START domain
MKTGRLEPSAPEARGGKRSQVMKRHRWLHILTRSKGEGGEQRILAAEEQIRAWVKANRRMKWGIEKEQFEKVQPPQPLTDRDRMEGFAGTVLFFGFGDDGTGHADAVLSGKRAWEYARKRRWLSTWQCEYIDLDKPDHIRLRPGAPKRPKGFYWAKLQPGGKYASLTVAQARKRFDHETGCSAEGIQFLAITHPHFQKLMNERKTLFMAFADYDVAPYGFNDFFDALQMFVSDDTVGMGIGNLDFKYRMFGIPTIRFQSCHPFQE